MWSLWADVNKGFSRLFLRNQQRGSFRLWILPSRISLTSSNLLKRGGGRNSSLGGVKIHPQPVTNQSIHSIFRPSDGSAQPIWFDSIPIGDGEKLWRRRRLGRSASYDVDPSGTSSQVVGTLHSILDESGSLNWGDSSAPRMGSKESRKLRPHWLDAIRNASVRRLCTSTASAKAQLRKGKDVGHPLSCACARNRSDPTSGERRRSNGSKPVLPKLNWRVWRLQRLLIFL